MAKRRESYYDSYWPTWEKTSPIAVDGGIRARSQRGKFVENWWATRWIKALTGLMNAGRLSRGRSYARRGQVLEIEVAAGRVTARVQGSRRTPYKVSIELSPLSDQQWTQALDELSERAIYAVQLLNGEMPPDIEQVFDAVRVPLFPESQGDLVTDCSCPDWVNPCKHIAAVYYLLGERLDEDPFLLLQLRGRSKDEITSALRERRARVTEGAVPETYAADVVEAVEGPTLEESLDSFWDLGAGVEGMSFEISMPDVELALLKRLGVPRFEGLVAHSFQAQMARVYEGVTQMAQQVAYAESPEQEEDG